MKLMPQGSFRWCTVCFRRWYTAIPNEAACPFCDASVKDATDGWPHLCARGHGADRGGACGECAEVGK